MNDTKSGADIRRRFSYERTVRRRPRSTRARRIGAISCVIVAADETLVGTNNDAFVGLGYPYASVVRLLLLTGQRLRQVGEMQWLEVDLAKALWTLPGDRAENGGTLEIPRAEVGRVIRSLYVTTVQDRM